MLVPIISSLHPSCPPFPSSRLYLLSLPQQVRDWLTHHFTLNDSLFSLHQSYSEKHVHIYKQCHGWVVKWVKGALNTRTFSCREQTVNNSKSPRITYSRTTREEAELWCVTPCPGYLPWESAAQSHSQGVKYQGFLLAFVICYWRIRYPLVSTWYASGFQLQPSDQPPKSGPGLSPEGLEFVFHVWRCLCESRNL